MKAHGNFFKKVIFFSVVAAYYCSGENAFEFRYFSGKKIPLKVLSSCNGSIVDTVMWEEKSGTFAFIACELKQGKGGEASWKSELTVTLYQIFGTDSISQIWKIYDFNNDPLTSVSYLRGTREVVDIDNDGLFETVFMYQKATDCCDPWIVKLMLHKNYEKLAIRGAIPIIKEDIESYQKNFDPAYEKYQENIRTFASVQWDKGIRMHWKSILGDSLVEQIVATHKRNENKEKRRHEPPPKSRGK